MKKELSNEYIIPTVLTHHGKVLTACGNVPNVFPSVGRFVWENFNSFAERHYFRRRESCGVIPLISGGREMLLFFDTFSPDVAPNMQLFFDESISKRTSEEDAPHFLYEELCCGGLSPAVSEQIFFEKYIRVLTVASFFDIDLSHTSVRRINLHEILKKATDLFSARHEGVIAPEVRLMPQVTENAETVSSPLALCAVVMLALSLLHENDCMTSLCVSRRDELFEVSVYRDSPSPGESVAYSESRAVLSDIFTEKSNEAALLFRMADAARLSVGYGSEGEKFYLSVSFKAHSLPPSLKALKLTANEEEIILTLANFLI